MIGTSHLCPVSVDTGAMECRGKISDMETRQTCGKSSCSIEEGGASHSALRVHIHRDDNRVFL